MDGRIHDWANKLIERLGVQGFRAISADLGEEGKATGARRGDFRAKWLFTKLYTFVLVQEVDVATAEHLRRLSQLSTDYAIRTKGGLPRGLQTGVAVLPVLVCRAAEDAAIALAEHRPPKRFAAFTLPMLVELPERRFFTYHEPGIWGAYYQDFLGAQQRLVAGELAGHVLPLGGERRANQWVLTGAAIGVVVGALVVFLVLFLGAS